MTKFSPLDILVKLKNEEYSQLELRKLISYAYRISLSHLKARYSYKLDSNKRLGLSLEDIAMDAIVPLFIKNSRNKIGIVKAVENWDQELNDNAEADYFLNKLILSRVEQTVVKTLKQKDPFFEKIHKTISTCISNHGLKKIYYFGTVYIVKESINEISSQPIPPDEFEKLPMELFNKKQIKLCDGIFNYLASETHYFPSIPLNALVKKIKEYYFNRQIGNGIQCGEQDFSIIVEEMLDAGINNVKLKLENFYLSKNKLTDLESNAILKSFEDISRDILSGGMHGSLCSYLENRMETLSKEEFYSKYHGIMNYLFNHFKNKIIQLVED